MLGEVGVLKLNNKFVPCMHLTDYPWVDVVGFC
jgi:hypothetical protein